MIEILNQQKRHKIDIKGLRVLLGKLVHHYGLDHVEITLALVNNKAITDLNRKFMGKEGPTDVLSFPIRDAAADGRYYLGDIIISIPMASKQSRIFAHSLQREVEHLALHGFLHLYGFEHAQGLEEEEKKLRKLLIEEQNGQ